MSLYVAGPNGERIEKSDFDLKQQEAQLKAKVLANARQRGAVKSEFKGYIKGEPIFGDPLDGLDAGSLDLLAEIDRKHNADGANPNIIPGQQQQQAPTIPTVMNKPVFRSADEQLIELMGTEPANKPKPTTKSLDTTKLFGF